MPLLHGSIEPRCVAEMSSISYFTSSRTRLEYWNDTMAMTPHMTADVADRPFSELLVKRIATFFAVLGAAGRAAQATENGRRPLARDLDTLGIPRHAWPEN